MRNIASLTPIAIWLGLSFCGGPALAANGPLFPEGYCRDTAPMTDQAGLAAVAQLFPDYVSNEGGRKAERIPLREVPLEKALEIMAESSTRRFGLADFLTDQEFRADCAYYFSAATLAKVYERFDIDIATPLHGVDENDRPFNMTAMVVGRSRLGVLFDRDRVTYHNERSDRNLSFHKTVYLDLILSDDGNIKYLASIRNLEVHTGFPYGWEPIEALRQMNGKVQTWVLGKWRSSAPVVPIAQRPTLNSDVLVARCPNGPGCPKGLSFGCPKGLSFGCPLPAAAFTPVPLRVDFTSLESLRRMTEMTAPFKGF